MGTQKIYFLLKNARMLIDKQYLCNTPLHSHVGGAAGSGRNFHQK